MAVVFLDLHESFYAYSHFPGLSGQPTILRADLNGQLREVFYPSGTKKADLYDPTITVGTYPGLTPFFIPLNLQHLDEHEPTHQTLTLTINARMLVCSETQCLPVRETVKHSWPSSALQNLENAADQPWAKKWRNAKADPLPPSPLLEPEYEGQSHSWDLEPIYLKADLEVYDLNKAIPLAFLAGLILNFMPCVLPVIGLKFRSLMGIKGIKTDDRSRMVRRHCLYFGLGAISFFILFGLLLAWADLAWGHLFQNKWVVIAMAVLVFALGLSLFGLFHLPVISLKALTSPTDGVRRNAIMGGFFATLLATPCSGPLLGGVLAWTLDQPPQIVAVVFFSLGIGMASPFFVLAAHPAWIRLFPKAGHWTVILEHAVAFCLFATFVYLISILVSHTVLLGLVIAWLTALTAWLFFIVPHLIKKSISKIIIRTLSIIMLGVGLFFLLRPGPPDLEWEDFNIDEFKEVLGREMILLEFTADWCPNCKLMEATVLTEQNIERWRRRYNFRAIKVDLTEDHAEETALLHALGSRSIPLTVIFPQGKQARKPIVLRDIATRSQVSQAFRQAKKLSDL